MNCVREVKIGRPNTGFWQIRSAVSKGRLRVANLGWLADRSPVTTRDGSNSRRLGSIVRAMDPGWLFVVLGIIVLSAGILIPAIQENRLLGEQLRVASRWSLDPRSI